MVHFDSFAYVVVYVFLKVLQAEENVYRCIVETRPVTGQHGCEATRRVLGSDQDHLLKVVAGEFGGGACPRKKIGKSFLYPKDRPPATKKKIMSPFF